MPGMVISGHTLLEAGFGAGGQDHLVCPLCGAVVMEKMAQVHVARDIAITTKLKL